MAADKTAVAEQAGADKSGPAAPEKVGARPMLRRALGRGLESLLRPAGASTSGAAVGTGPMAPAAVAEGANAAAMAPGPQVAPEGATGHGEGAAVPGVIAGLHAQAVQRKADGHEVLDIAIELIDLNPHQTRSWTKWEIDSLGELRESIKIQGVLQPVTVRPGKGGRYTLITGERRMRASQMAGKATIPAIVRIVSEQQAAEMTVIENLQRRDLNCVDLARAYIMLSKDFNLTQEQIGERVGVARESVSNYMRLAKLPQETQIYLQNGDLGFSHARILLNLEDAAVINRVALKAVEEDWSVDKLEHFVLFDASMAGVKRTSETNLRRAGGARWVDPNVRAAQRELERILGVRVRIRDKNGKGKITLEYSTLGDFDRVVGMLKGKG
jgi:ParB family chromosome partitioning protein